MEKILYPLLFILTLGLIGCNNECPFAKEPIDEKSEPYTSELYVNFVDTAGNSLATELSKILEYKSDKESYQYKLINHDIFNLYFHHSSICRGYKTRNLEYATSDLKDYTLKFYDSQQEEAPVYVRYDFKCSAIFGDEEYHVIESTYETQSQNSDHILLCTSFILDGKPYSVDEQGHVTVELNRLN